MGDFEIKREIYENGLTLICNPLKGAETVAISGSIKSGAMFDEQDSLGAAELVSRLLLRGTRTRNSLQISRSLEEVGSKLEFSNDDDSVFFSGRCYYTALTSLLNTLKDSLMEPVFPREEINHTRSEILSELSEQEDETRSVAYKELMGLIYGKKMPYGRDSLGKKKDLRHLSRRDLKLFYEKNYLPTRVVLGIIGRFEFDTLRNTIERMFSSWSGTHEPLTFRTKIKPSHPKIVKIAMNHKSQVDLAIGARAVERNSRHYYSLNLGNLVLGRMGLYGRLGKNVREKRGLAYYSYSVVNAKLFAGSLNIFAGVNPLNVEKAFEGIVEEISKISTESLTENELAAARKNALGSLSIALDTSIERVKIIHDIQYYGLGIDYLERYAEILSQVTAKQILDDFAKYLSVDRVSMAAVGPVSNKRLSFPKAELISEKTD